METIHNTIHVFSFFLIIYLLFQIGKLWASLKHVQLDKQKVINEFTTSSIRISTLNKQIKLYAKINEAFQEQEFEIIPDLNEKLRKEIDFETDFFKDQNAK